MKTIHLRHEPGSQGHLQAHESTYKSQTENQSLDEDYTEGKPLGEGEHNPNQLLSFTHVLNEIEHIRLAVAG